MKPEINLQNMFEKNPTKSILNLLVKFKKNGLRPIYILYAINPDNFIKQKNKPEHNTNIDRMKDFFGNKLDFLYKKQLVIIGSIRTKETLNHYLKKLEKLEVIKPIGKKHKNKKYKISDSVYGDGLRIQNKESFDIFPQDKIIDFNVWNKKNTHIDRKIILYGFSKTFIKNIPDGEKIIDNLKETLNQTLEKLDRKKSELWEKENNKRLKNFYNNTDNDKIKKVIEKKGINLLGDFSFSIDLSKAKLGKFTMYRVDLTKSKGDFFIKFLYGAYRSKDNNVWIESPFSEIEKKGNPNFFEVVDNLSDKKYSKLWCETFLHKKFNLNRKDIIEIINWVWENRDFFDMFSPFDSAISVYGSRSQNPLLRSS